MLSHKSGTGLFFNESFAYYVRGSEIWEFGTQLNKRQKRDQNLSENSHSVVTRLNNIILENPKDNSIIVLQLK